MNSKQAIALFLSLGLTTTLVACAGGERDGDGDEQAPVQEQPTSPQGGEGGES